MTTIYLTESLLQKTLQISQIASGYGLRTQIRILHENKNTASYITNDVHELK